MKVVFSGTEEKYARSSVNISAGTRMHTFTPQTFIRPSKCMQCLEKVWGNESRCQG